MPRLDGRSAIVTGGGMGMGRAIALRLAAEGACVSVLDIDEEAAEESCTLIRDRGGDAISLACDLGRTEQIEAAVTRHVAHRGRVDILVNNAGVMHRDDDLLEAASDEAWAFTFAINLLGPQALCAAVLPHMIAAGRGAILTSASNAGIMGTTRPVYGSSKGAVIGMTLALARRHAADGIRANVVLPGAFATPMLDKVRDFPITVRQPRYRPLGRLGDPSEITGMIAFLASDDAAAINGVIVPVDGGATAV